MSGRFRLKNLHWVSRNRYEQRALEKKPRSWLSYHALSSYWGTKSYFFFAGTFKNTHTAVNLKYQSKGPIYTLHLLSFVEIRLNVFFWERKTGFGNVMKKLCRILVKKERGCGIRTPPPLPPPPSTASLTFHSRHSVGLCQVIVADSIVMATLHTHL